jgi:hypothetical protein
MPVPGVPTVPPGVPVPVPVVPVPVVPVPVVPAPPLVPEPVPVPVPLPAPVVVESEPPVLPVEGATAQVGLVKVSSSNVTAPVRARARPWTVTLVVTVIEVRARMFPTKTELVPSVAELPTCQKTLHSWAPLISVTVLPDPVVSVELVWKMKTELGSPAPSRTSGPVRLSGDLLGPA